MFKYILPLLISFSIYADFKWDGKSYYHNSESQKIAALTLLKEMGLSGDEAILDLGCGDGKITDEMSRLVPNGYIVGIDLSPSQIAFAKKMEGRNLSFKIEDVQQLSYNKEFDLATAFTMIQWIPDQLKAFKVIHDSLKSHGKLLITVPTGITWQLSEAVREVIAREEWKAFPFQDKQFFFTRENYAPFLREAGFVIESFKIMPSYNLFPNREIFTAFVKQWLPFVQDVPVELRDEFMKQVVEVYLTLIPLQNSGEVFFDKYVYNIVARRAT